MGLRSYPSGSFEPETSSTSFSLMRSDRPVYATASIRPSGPCQPSTAMAGPTFSYLRNPYPHLATFDSQSFPLVRGSEHNSPGKAYSRLSERDSRPPISSESANIDRVVPPPRDRETYLQALGDSRGRHVCNSVELPPSFVHVSNSGAISSSGGCSVSGLAGEVNVHVSSIPTAQQSHSEATIHQGGRGSSHSPLVAESVMVSTPTSSLCGTPPGLSLPSGSSVPPGSEVCLGRKVVPSARIEALM